MSRMSFHDEVRIVPYQEEWQKRFRQTGLARMAERGKCFSITSWAVRNQLTCARISVCRLYSWFSLNFL